MSSRERYSNSNLPSNRTSKSDKDISDEFLIKASPYVASALVICALFKDDLLNLLSNN